MRRYLLLSLLGSGILLPGCEASPSAVEPSDARFVAVAEGSVQASYEGRGFFHLFEPPAGVPRPASFSLFSSERDAATRQAQSFHFTRAGGESPAVGVHPLGRTGADIAAGFTATYVHTGPSGMAHYLATDGELQITLSTPERVEGSFLLTGVRICSGTGNRMSCTFSPHQQPDPEAPTVQVSGSFSAVRAPAGPLVR